MKGMFLDDRLRLNLSAFYYDYRDYQANVFRDLSSSIENAADAEIYGLEGEISLVATENLRFDAGFSLQKSKFKEFVTEDEFLAIPDPTVNLEGNALPRAPEVSLFINASYSFKVGDSLEGTLRYEFSYTDDYFFTPFNAESAKQDGYTISNARLVLKSADDANGWEAHLFVKNITDKDYKTLVLASPTFGGTIEQYAPRRTWGLELFYRF
jgi:iron complex outermembrane receptor protein